MAGDRELDVLAAGGLVEHLDRQHRRADIHIEVGREATARKLGPHRHMRNVKS